MALIYRQFDFYTKTLYHADHIRRYLRGARPVPINVEIDLTNGCNHRCAFCQWGAYIQEKRASLPADLVRRTLGELRGLGTRSITWTGGGEPTLHRAFFDLLALADGIGLDNGLITNGSRLVAERDGDLLPRLRWLRVSMAGGDPESYRRVQGRDDFERVLANLARLAAFKRREGLAVDIGVAFLVNRTNAAGLSPFGRRLAEIGVDYLQVREDMHADEAERRWWRGAVAPEVERLAAEVGPRGLEILGAGYVDAQRAVGYPARCHAHHFVAAINAEGHVCFCKNTRDRPEFAIGNLHERTFTEIWEGSARSRELEAAVAPANCGVFCKNMEINRAVEDAARGRVALPEPGAAPAPPRHRNFL